MGGIVKRVDRRRRTDFHVCNRPVLLHVECEDDVPLHRHGHIGNDPVTLYLGDEPADPRTELDALRIELNRRAELTRVSLLPIEFKISQCIAH